MSHIAIALICHYCNWKDYTKKFQNCHNINKTNFQKDNVEVDYVVHLEVDRTTFQANVIFVNLTGQDLFSLFYLN